MQSLKYKKVTIYPFRNKYFIHKRSLATTDIKNNNQYQIMQRSKLPTLYFQKSLPHLPIPKLRLTCERFAAAVKPLLDDAEYQSTVKMLSEFEKGEGRELQTILRESDSANSHTSYISRPWSEMYLSDRSPLPLNYNPLLMMNNDIRKNYQDQLLRATNLVISSLRFWRSLQENLLKPEIYHLNAAKTDTEQFQNLMLLAPRAIATYSAYALNAYPLDMSQFSHLFGVSRIPKNGKDVLVQNKSSTHILVMRGGNMYAVDVLDKKGNIEDPITILGRLRAVLRMDEASGVSKVPLGVLTSLNRDEWAATRQHLIENVGGENKNLLEKEIDSALFCLCFDKPNDPVYSEESFTPLIKHLLAGDGTNRWFDKSVSLILSADGTAALNFEHSWGDGVAVLRYFNEIYKDTMENPFANPHMGTTTLTYTGSVRPIKIKTDTVVENLVHKTIVNNKNLMDELSVDILRYPHINKALCKQKGISPDAIMQLSFQLAYKRAFNDYVGTYESCSTSAFRHGRTETVRPCTIATKELCESLMQKNGIKLNLIAQFDLIKKCSNLHNKLTREAAMGQGFDRHLFALKHQAIAHNKRLPQIYNSKAYNKINYNIISTSTLSSNALLAGSFGPVTKDGLGIAYSIQDENCSAAVTSYKKHRNGKEFVDSLAKALNDFYEILRVGSK